MLVCGINHKSAPLNIREKLVFSPEQTPLALHDLLLQEAVNEAMLLSTCNRTEIYITTDEISVVLDWLSAQLHLVDAEIPSFFYAHRNVEMVRHVMRLASGLDSMVLGEPRILGQLKQAYELACRHGAVGAQLKDLFPAPAAVLLRRNGCDIKQGLVLMSFPLLMRWCKISEAHFFLSGGLSGVADWCR